MALRLTEQDGELNRLAIAATTRRNYDRALSIFLRWAREHNRDFNGAEDTDMALNDFANFTWRLNPARGAMRTAMDARSAVLHYNPRLGALPLSLQALKGWERSTESNTKYPMSLLMARAIAARLAERRHYNYAAAVLISFDCLLRPSDIRRLTKDCYIIQPAGWFLAMHRRDKTRTEAAVLCDDLHAVAALEGWFSTAGAKDVIVPQSYEAYLRAFKIAAADVGLGQFQLTPHCCRHGGAVDRVYKRGHDEKVVQRFGRWESEQAFRNYLQLSKVQQMEQELSEAKKQVLIGLAQQLPCQSTIWRTRFQQNK